MGERKYKQFKVVIETQDHLQAVETELKRLGYTFGGDLSVGSGEPPTCVTVWEQGDYEIWSMAVTATSYQHHNRTLTLLDLTKMKPEDVLEVVCAHQ